ncbi:hypothetical protein MtrunA17_Chr6g0450231 [Medicago truncatula]|uniref:Uncharacterized protein n=1 Tax=Medicago truncatula TaxID=3880 RepID=A0A0C3VSV2_MEDTR|nr:hypothetical protein MTR_6g006300 [Medicago truncatula]RHN49777.1 hypothetical protein MtrunA17_Chr6g0450231 [Medicago truncatula]
MIETGLAPSDGDLKPVNMVVQLAHEFLFQCQEVRSRLAASIQHQQQHIEAWQLPNEDFMKWNVDAAMFEAQRCFCIGMYIQNSRDHFLKAAPLLKKRKQWNYVMRNFLAW